MGHNKYYLGGANIDSRDINIRFLEVHKTMRNALDIVVQTIIVLL
jgi:hypothetical protein